MKCLKVIIMSTVALACFTITPANAHRVHKVVVIKAPVVKVFHRHASTKKIRRARLIRKAIRAR